ncbi:hypothetical protein [Spirosoma telluris]|uniref:hypothetical protein n=1 Tax=Spirosoma telluris TaxID=2183553 RepID=UPI002FC2DEE3
MRTLLFFFAASLSGSFCLAQNDSTKVINQEPVQKQVAIPGIDTPISGGGLTAQTPTNPMPPVQNNKKRKTLPPATHAPLACRCPLVRQRKIR